MTDLIAKGVKAARTAEAALRDLMQTAVRDGQYESVAVLARWAEQLAQIGAGAPPEPATNLASTGVAASDLPPPTTARKSRRVRKRGKSKYPTFRRAGDALIRIAWSKASRSEYQHHSPKHVAIALLRKMQALGRKDQLLTMGEVLPLSSEDGAEVPAYQTYACLAWLREIGAVTQHGRRGYSVDSATPPDQVVERSWSLLPVLKR